MHCQARIAHSFDQLPNSSRYAPHAATRQSAGYCVSTPAERPGKGDEAGGRAWILFGAEKT